MGGRTSTASTGAQWANTRAAAPVEVQAKRWIPKRAMHAATAAASMFALPANTRVGRGVSVPKRPTFRPALSVEMEAALTRVRTANTRLGGRVTAPAAGTHRSAARLL